MKKVRVNYTATIEKTLEISDELYDAYKNWDKLEDASGPFWALVAEFEKQGPICPEIYIQELNCVEDVETEEYIFEY